MGAEFLTELLKTDSKEDVTAFIDEAIEQLPKLSLLPKGHLAKPFKMDDGAYLHIMETGFI
jgi:hypothetical protein